MYNIVEKMEKNFRKRNKSDKPLVNYFLYCLLLNQITFGIYSIVVFFNRCSRVNSFILRKSEYYTDIINIAYKKAKLQNNNEVSEKIEELKRFYMKKYKKEINVIDPIISLIIAIVTFGIYGFILFYRMNRIWNDLQKFEYEFDKKLMPILLELKIIKHPIEFEIEQSKNRNFILYLILSIVTFGIFMIVWDYKIHTDPNNMYEEFHYIEDKILENLKQTASDINVESGDKNLENKLNNEMIKVNKNIGDTPSEYEKLELDKNKWSIGVKGEIKTNLTTEEICKLIKKKELNVNEIQVLKGGSGNWGIIGENKEIMEMLG